MHSKENGNFEGNLAKLEEKGRKITLEDEQRKAVKQLHGKKGLVAVLPTGEGHCVFTQDVCLCVR